MVLGICRHVLNEEHEAEDAFQATFLVLAQKGSTIRNRNVLAGWLHEVAHRIAIKARVSVVRRRTLERQAMAMSPAPIEPDKQDEAAAWNELRPVLHAEVDRLPEKYRLPVILCYLEGKTNEEVAELLHWPVGSVKGRLSRARDTLAFALDAPRAGPVGRLPADCPFAGQSFRRDRAGRAGEAHRARWPASSALAGRASACILPRARSCLQAAGSTRAVARSPEHNSPARQAAH